MIANGHHINLCSKLQTRFCATAVISTLLLLFLFLQQNEPFHRQYVTIRFVSDQTERNYNKSAYNPLDLILLPRLNCSNSSLDLVIVLKSSAVEFDLRDAIRDTWGSDARDAGVPVIFVLGIPKGKDAALQRIREESDKHGDIVLANFDEAYLNLTVKVLAMIQWEAMHCSTAHSFFHTDNDCIVFSRNVLELVRRKKFSNTILGHCWLGGAQVARTGTNSVSATIWPAAYWPPYCSGSGYLLSGDVPMKLLNLMPNLEWLQSLGMVEDVVFTGILSANASVARVHTNNIWYYKVDNIGSSSNQCNDIILSAHRYKTANDQRLYWKKFSGYRSCKGS